MQSRTTGAIAMRPTGNKQGGYYFFRLSTGRRLNRNRWTKLPMPNEVVDRVHLYAQNNKRGLTFGTQNGLPDDDNPFDSDGKSYDDGDDSDNGADNESVEYDSEDSNYSNEDDDVDPINTNLPITGVTENMVPVPQQNVDPCEQNVDPRNSDSSGSDESYSDHDNTSEDPTGYDSPDSPMDQSEDTNEDDSDNKDYDRNTDSRSDSGDDDDRAETTDNNNDKTGIIVEPITDFDNDEEQENVPGNATINQQQDTDQAVIDQRMRQLYGNRSSAHNLRPRRP
jgi:hypothetical protein